MIQDRKDLPALIRAGGVGVEIGVDCGVYSEHILANSQLSLLYSVDPWSASHPGFDNQKQANIHYIFACQRLRPYGDRSAIRRMTGEEFAAFCTLGQFAFVYIDSDHTYATTKEQMELYWPLVEVGGMLAGHDYINGHEVRQAVDEFALHMGLTLETTVNDEGWGFPVNSWILRK